MLPGNEDERVEFLKWLFEKNFMLRMDKQCCRFYFGFVFYVFTSVRHPNFCDMLKVGLISGLWRYGYGTVNRMLAIKNWFEEKEIAILRVFNKDNTQMIRLERMTVLPSYQGKGVGTASLNNALEDADKVWCILERTM